MEFITTNEIGVVDIQRSADKEYHFYAVDIQPMAKVQTDKLGRLFTARLAPHTTYLLLTLNEIMNAPKTVQNAPARQSPVLDPEKGLDASLEASQADKQARLHGKLRDEGLDASMRRAGLDPDKPAVAQVGGGHYQRAGVQHWDYAWQLPYLEGQASRYLDRHAKSGGYGAKDVLKSLSYTLKLLEMAYGESWARHKDMLQDMQSKLAEAYKTECAVPKYEAVESKPRATGMNLFCPACGNTVRPRF